jgi:hypothetical protein
MAICILLPVFTLYYKNNVLDLSLIPVKASNVWNIEITTKTKNIENRNAKKDLPMALPIPQSSSSQVISDLKVVKNAGTSIINSQPYEPFVYFEPEDEVLVKFEVTTRSYNYFKAEPPQDVSKLASDPKFLSLTGIDENTFGKLKQLSDAIVYESDSNLDKLKKIFFYIADEVVLQPNDNNIIDVIELSSGDHLAQAKTLSALARLNGIPSRVGFGLKILNTSEKEQFETKFRRFFFVESFVKGRWLPLVPDERLFGVVDAKHVLISQDADLFADFLDERDFVGIKALPVQFDPMTSKEQLQHLGDVSPVWSLFSLHRFSLPIQAIFLGIVLIPFGTVFLSLFRVVIGIETFGIFMPILLTLFFLETSFVFGFCFLFLVVLLGFSQRALLDRFHLLAVPRLSILLGIVILLYILFAVFADSMGLLAISGKTLNYFPIVIITVFIERFSIYFIEEGPVNTLKTTAGTFLVSTACYYLLSYKWLKVFLFNNPEVLLLAIGLNLALGSYRGYRLSELFRFKDFGKTISGKAGK